MLYTKNSTVIFSLTAKIAQIVGIKVKKQNFFVIILHNVNFFSNFAKIAQKFHLLFNQYFTPPPREKCSFFDIFDNIFTKNKHKYLVVSKFLTTFAPEKQTWCP